MGAETIAAILNLGDIKNRMCRNCPARYLGEVYVIVVFNRKHPSVANSTTWDAMMQRAVVDVRKLELHTLDHPEVWME